MTSFHSTTHQQHYASTTTPFQILPSCRFHGDQQQLPTDSSNNTLLTGSSLSRRQSTHVNTHMNVHDWNNATFHHATEKLVHGPNGTNATVASSTTSTTAATTGTNMLPLHTDPEMYALKSKHGTSSSSSIMKNQGTNSNNKNNKSSSSSSCSSSSSNTSSSTSSVTVKPTQYVNNRLAYVEALVDTNAHVIETIWSTSPTSSSLSLSSSSSISSSSSSSSSSHYNSKSAVVPLRTFIQEVLKRSRTTYSTLQTALFYLFRARPAILTQLYERNNSNNNTSHFSTTDRHANNNANYPYWQDAYISCGRRMFLASLVIASKFVQDKTYRNSAWAKIAGLPVSEINAAERIFLELIDYRLYIAQPTFEQWHHLLHLHVESRALNRPIPLLHDLSCLPTGHGQSTHPLTANNPNLTHPHTNVSLPSLHSSHHSLHLHDQQQYQLPSPQSPTDHQQQQQQQHPHFTLPALMNNTTTTTTSSTTSACDHYYQHSHYHLHHEQQPTSITTRRKRRLRETSMDDQYYHHRHPYSILSPPSSCSPSSNGGYSTTTSYGYSPSVGMHHHHHQQQNGGIPPVLSLSLPSSSSSSPMHTPTQISPVRMNQHTLPLTSSWKMNQHSISPPSSTHYGGGRPYMVSDVRQQTPDYFSHPPTSSMTTCSKKRRMTTTTSVVAAPTSAFDPYTMQQQSQQQQQQQQQGYAVSHVRSMKRKQYKSRQ